MKFMHEKFSSYIFAGAIAVVMITCMALELSVVPSGWANILLRRLVSIAAATAGWWMYRAKPIRIHLSLSHMKMLALLPPAILLGLGKFWYHSLLFPVGAIIVFALMIYTFFDDHVDFSLIGIIITSVAFFKLALAHQDPSNAVFILIGSIVMIVTIFDLKWFFADTDSSIRWKQVVSLILLAATLVLSEAFSEFVLVANAATEQPVAPSLLKTIHFFSGDSLLVYLFITYSFIIFYGWCLVVMNQGIRHYCSVGAMTILTLVLLGDVLKAFDIRAGLPGVGLGVESVLEMSLLLICAFTVLPPDHLLPGGRKYRYEPAYFDFKDYELPDDFDFEDSDYEEEPEDTNDEKNKSTDYVEFLNWATAILEFVTLYTTLTDCNRDIALEKELDMWQKVWFEHTERITDAYQEKLDTHFQQFCEKCEVFKR